MARLGSGEKDQIRKKIYRLVQRHYNGLQEQEIAQMTNMDRRRVNNYLNELKKSSMIYREGRSWFAE